MKIRFLKFLFTVATGIGIFSSTQVEAGTREGTEKSVKNSHFHASEEFFDGPVTRLKIEIAPASWSALQRNNRQYAKARISEGEKVYRDVGVHLKGAAGSFRSLDQNPSLTLNFDKFAKEQKFHGLDKIHLNNSVQDPSLITYGLCGELFRKAGVPASRVTHARIELNGRDLGLYVLVEGYDKTFLRNHFNSGDGNFYDGGFVHDIAEGLQKTSGANPNEQSDLKALVAAAREPDLALRFARLEKVLDVERFASYLAMEVMIWDWDGYPLNRNNYRLYHDPGSDRIVFLPHGMDQMFWDAGGSMFPGMQGFIAAAFLQTPQGRARYLNRFSELYSNVFNVNFMTNRVSQLEQKIQKALREFNPGAARNHAAAAADIRNKIAARGQNLGQQIANLPRPLQFDSSGVALLRGWHPKEDRQNPRNSKMDRPTGTGAVAKTFLRISTASAAPGIGSWRTRVSLEPGSYRFEGLVKTSGVVSAKDEKGEGAGLRISGTTIPRQNHVTGSTNWQKLEFDFSIPPALQDVELVCELRAMRGEAWFDPDSLKLLRRSPPKGKGPS